MAKQRNIRETNGDMKNRVCDNLGIHSFNGMTASEYPTYEYHNNKRKEISGKIYNHDILF